jgi:hypothetical protein
MTKKTPAPHKTKKRAKVAHPGMMGDGTEEQNLGERGNPAARIKKGRNADNPASALATAAAIGRLRHVCFTPMSGH